MNCFNVSMKIIKDHNNIILITSLDQIKFSHNFNNAAGTNMKMMTIRLISSLLGLSVLQNSPRAMAHSCETIFLASTQQRVAIFVQ